MVQILPEHPGFSTGAPPSLQVIPFTRYNRFTGRAGFQITLVIIRT